MNQERLDDLEQRVEALEDNGTKVKRTRRGALMITGAAAMSALAGVTGIVAGGHTVEGNAPHGTALLIGTEAQRPPVGSRFFERQIEFHYLYLATDTGARYILETDDPDWTELLTQLKSFTLDDLPEKAAVGAHVWLTDENVPAIFSEDGWRTAKDRWN